MLRPVPLVLLCFLSLPAQAAQRLSLGLGFSEEGTGPVLEFEVGRWNGEMRGQSGKQRESFLVELRHPIQQSLALIGGTRHDHIEPGQRGLAYEGDTLFAGLRFHLRRSALSPFGAIRLLHGSATVRSFDLQQVLDVKGVALEAGLILSLPASTTMPILRRSGRFELVPTVEFQQLSPVDLEFTTIGLQIRYTMEQPP